MNTLYDKLKIIKSRLMSASNSYPAHLPDLCSEYEKILTKIINSRDSYKRNFIYYEAEDLPKIKSQINREKYEDAANGMKCDIESILRFMKYNKEG